MIRVGTLSQLQLSALLNNLEMHKRTGKILVIQENEQADVYIYLGKVVAVISANLLAPLTLRLIRSGVLSLNDLQMVPANVRQITMQSQGTEKYNDIETAKILIELGLITHERLTTWVTQQTTEALHQLLLLSSGEIYFEEGLQPPTDCLCILPQTTFIEPTQFVEKGKSREEKNTPSELFASPKTLPVSFNKEQGIEQFPTVKDRFVPVIPSGFAQVPKTVLSTQTAIQRAVTALLPHAVSHHVSTVKIAIPQRRNPLLSWETFLILVVLLIAGLAHGINMFHYPYYEDDEGTYLSQAWAVIHLGKLAYYTYWYDHAPGGWIQIAFWTAITGGFHTFGSAMNSGRIFMLLIQLGSTFILYRIARTISGNITVAIIVALLFALSPYGLYYHRRILLDNIMTFWMLLSILLLLAQRLPLRNVWLSGVALAISILSKEVTVFIIPALAYLVWIRTSKLQRRIAFVGWLTIVFSILSTYFLLAILKGELFPSGTFLGGNNPHVSLLGSILYQGSRSNDGGILNPASLTRLRINTWIQDDFTLTALGSICSVISLLFIKKYPLVGAMGIITLSLWAFIIRGGVVLDFYFLPLIPMLAINIGMVLWLIGKYSKMLLNAFVKINVPISNAIQTIVVIAYLVSIVASIPLASSGTGLGASNVGNKNDPFIYWNGTQADAQNEAVAWVENYVTPNSRIIADMYMWPDLYDKGYIYTHYYWKVQADPAIGNGVFHNDWRNVDYLITTPQMLVDMQNENMKIIKLLIEHSTTVAAFDTGGWRIDIRKVRK